MADIKSTYSNYVKWTLKSESESTLIMETDPGGWSDDSIEIVRHKDYHGIFTNFTNDLSFYGDAKEYIKRAYYLGGINTDLRLTKYVLRDKDGEVKWVEFYSGLADFSTMKETSTEVKVNFNSNDLAELISSHEDDDFEIDRTYSIDDVYIGGLDLKNTEIKGRSLNSVAESVLNPDEVLYAWNDNGDFTTYSGRSTFRTKLISPGDIRFQTVVDGYFSGGEYGDDIERITSDNMFFANVIVPENDLYLDITIKERCLCITNVNFGGAAPPALWGYAQISLVKYKWLDDGSDEFVEIEREILFNKQYEYVGNNGSDTQERYEVSCYINRTFTGMTTEYDECYAIIHEARDNNGNLYSYDNGTFWIAEEQNIQLNVTSFYEASPDLSFLFVKDVLQRLLQIITGKDNNLETRLFSKDDENNSNDGKYGLIGLISGYWVRAFDQSSEKYKSLTTSLKDLLDSLKVVFNVGIGIERIDNIETLVVEDLKHFYREKTVIHLPFQITNVKRSVDATLFFSGTEIGYSQGGDYENEIGLDEPNTVTSTVTPIRKSSNKYTKKSKIRADEYGMEIARRKPQIDYPDEDTRYDDDIWFLDTKRQFLEDGITQAPNYTQSNWDDRLQELPTGIHSPETFRSMLFTPLTILFRHGWILRAGMEQYREKTVKYISGDNNTTLSMLWNEEEAYGVPNQRYAEEDDILVNDFDRSRFEPEIVEFDHPVDDDLMDLILDKTYIQEEDINVPNWYFKFSYINEDGEIEKGYLMELKPQGVGKFKMLKANQKLL